MRAASRKRFVLWILVAFLALFGPDRVGAMGVPPFGLSDNRLAVFLRANPTSSLRMARRLLLLVNEARWERGIPPLKAHFLLSKAARAHALSMAQEDYFSHWGSDGSSPWERIEAAGYEIWLVLAENIAAGYATPGEVLAAWMESPRHRSNLLNPELCEAGVGYAFQPGDTYPGGNWGYEHYWTMDMGCRWDAFPLVIALEAYSTTTRQVSLYLYGRGWAREMRLSNDRTNWGAWQPYRPSLTWELTPGDGPKTVYAELRDAQGNVMYAEDDILLREQPQVPSLLVSPREAFFVLGQGQSIGQPRRYTLQVDASDGPVSWRAATDQGWLTLDASFGTTPGRPNLTLAGPAALLPPGLYTATVSVEAGKAQVRVSVRLFVFPRLHSLYLPLLSGRRPAFP